MASGLLALGAFHGLNPAMGWLFAVALGMQDRDLKVMPTRLVSPWTGLTHRPSWCLRDQVRGAVVLAGRAISVPFRARRQRFVTVSHGHS